VTTVARTRVTRTATDERRVWFRADYDRPLARRLQRWFHEHRPDGAFSGGYVIRSRQWWCRGEQWEALRGWLTSVGVQVVDESDESTQHGA
jgi:hypothetical protein